jgi:hypothetical protein
MYVANIVDTGPFRAVGKPPSESYAALKRAVTTAEAVLRLPPTIYRELGGTITETEAPSGSEYVDDAIREGWVAVAESLPGEFSDDRSDATGTVERARHDAHHVIAQTANHPKTVNEWADTALVGLAVRLFERNEQIRVILHTTDRPLEKAARVVVPEYGYHDIKTRWYPPKSVKEHFPKATSFRW